MERLLVAAVEEQVADGRPRDLVEAKEPFRMVSDHFIGKVCQYRILSLPRDRVGFAISVSLGPSFMPINVKHS